MLQVHGSAYVTCHIVQNVLFLPKKTCLCHMGDALRFHAVPFFEPDVFAAADGNDFTVYPYLDDGVEAPLPDHLLQRTSCLLYTSPLQLLQLLL